MDVGQGSQIGLHVDDSALDLVGGPFAVVESDPGVFSSLIRRLGTRGLELVEMYDIEPWAVDHLNPHGLIFCFMWHKDSHRPTEFDDPAAERVWFANQLSDDACATHAVLNVLMNCPEVDIGDQLREFKRETEQMSPVMRGLAVTNFSVLRRVHNSLARPADIRGALNLLVGNTFDAEKAKAKAKAQRKKASARGKKPPPTKRKGAVKSPISKDKRKVEEEGDELEDEAAETYHFIGYVPAFGKVWELDGLKSGPLEVGELPLTSGPVNKRWMDVVRPALRMKMEKYGGSANGGNNIRFSLLALVDDIYERASDEMEFLRRDKVALERNMDDNWHSLVDSSLLESSQHLFVSNERISFPARPYAQDFNLRRMMRDKEISEMTPDLLLAAWQRCVQESMRAKLALEDEVSKTIAVNTDNIKRTFDYEPFFREFIGCLHKEKLLYTLLGLDQNGKRKKARVVQENKPVG